ncbi:MAG: hypothetical protein QOE92_808 [Chloroflexota bacterium]|jgi:ribosomal protein S18 acetylase RimI-like enzyme|nr:hypothetical protein [Chloroflexota bacterium]
MEAGGPVAARPRPPREVHDAILRDGTRVRFRPIRPADKALLQRGMRRLSSESRYKRFFAAIDELSPEQLRYFTEIDYHDHFAWIGVIPGRRPSMAVAVGRWVRLADDAEAAEAAITVLDEYHRQGVGSAILLLLARSAIERGVKRFVMSVLGENEAMMRLLTERGAVLDGYEDGVAQLHVPLPASIEELDRSPLPRILKAAAEGRFFGRFGPLGAGLRFDAGEALAEVRRAMRRRGGEE